MIFVKYFEEVVDTTSGIATSNPLGSEFHENIEEVLLPSSPDPGNPIFFTKKFVGQAEYRWEVLRISMDASAAQRTYVVTLGRRVQIDKQYYLKNILAARKHPAQKVLFPWAIVEVEFGHPLTIGKEDGAIRTSKRYVDTMQHLSMPKRRLAIVNQVHSDRDELIQVIPISSRSPNAGDNSVVEVTSCLTNMAHYQKPSWAICGMIQTVTASRIIAPMVTATGHHWKIRDKGFKTQVRGSVRTAIKDSIMFGVKAEGRVAAAQRLSEVIEINEALVEELSVLKSDLRLLSKKVSLFEKWAADENITMVDLEELYPN